MAPDRGYCFLALYGIYCPVLDNTRKTRLLGLILVIHIVYFAGMAQRLYNRRVGDGVTSITTIPVFQYFQRRSVIEKSIAILYRPRRLFPPRQEYPVSRSTHPYQLPLCFVSTRFTAGNKARDSRAMYMRTITPIDRLSA